MSRSRNIAAGSTRQDFIYTATADQTTFTGSDSNSNTLSYTAGLVEVFVNGTRLSAADFTATNGTSIVLASGADLNDNVNIVAYGVFSVADKLVQRTEFDYTATGGQTSFSGNDNDGQSLSYTPGKIDVYLNGSHLNVTDDYVASNGTSVVLQAGATAGDILQVINHGATSLVGNFVDGEALDTNGNEIILDADGDTSLHASTDDQIDVKISGADDFTFTANDFTALSGSAISTDTINETTSAAGVTVDGVLIKDGGVTGTIDVNGTSDGIILDADADTTISADTDDQIDIKVGGTDRVTINAAGNVSAVSFTGDGSNLTSLPSAQLSGDLPTISGANLTALAASVLTGNLPAIDGSALTALTSSALSGNLPALNGSALTNLTSGNLVGALPAIDGSALTGITSGLTQSAFSQNQNGYLKLSNNWLIQWGRQGSLSNGSATNVNFPITFPTVCWAVAACWGVQTSGTWHSAFPSINTTRFTAHNVSGSTQSCYFIAVGK